MTTDNILIIDDDPDLREALYAALTQAGFVALSASNGAEGLSLALAHHPKLILLDIMMPQMNGHQTLKELRKDSWGKHAQVLFLTNMDDPKNMIQGFGLNGTDYIIKSNASLEEIVKRVKQVLAGYT